MNSQISFILKIAIASLLLSELVKYGGRALPITGNNLTAIIIILLPAIILSVYLSWRYFAIANKAEV